MFYTDIPSHMPHPTPVLCIVAIWSYWNCCELLVLLTVYWLSKAFTLHHHYLYNSVIFEGATLVYRPDCNAEGGCHANSARAKRRRYWLWQPPEALQEGRYTSVAPEQNHAIIIITTWSHDVSSFYKLFVCGPVPWGGYFNPRCCL